jgi:transcriptional regulator with XRE-family HTH domain
MIDRISLLIKAKNLSAAQFADEIGVQRSSISHLMSGRNKPSLDLIQKTLQRFPEVSSEWLLFGKGEMVRELNLFDAQTRAVGNNLSENKMQAMEMTLDNESIRDIPIAVKANIPEIKEEASPKIEYKSTQNKENPRISELPQASQDTLHHVRINEEPEKESGTRSNRKEKSIDQIIVLYSDHTFVAYSPGN